MALNVTSFDSVTGFTCIIEEIIEIILSHLLFIFCESLS